MSRAEPDEGQQPPFWAGKRWAEYSPYAPAASYKSLPHGCTLKQVNIVSNNSSLVVVIAALTTRLQLERHGARYPTAKARNNSLDSLAKLTSVSRYTDPGLNFLKNYTVVLGADDLLPLGAIE